MRIVLTSVRYADFLAATLAAWKAVVPAGCLTLATSPDDSESRQLALQHDVPVIVTDAWTRMDRTCHVGGAPGFNMALGLDLALGLIPGQVQAPEPGEICGHVNADCYPSGCWPKAETFLPDTIYGFWRYDCQTPADFQQYLTGRKPANDFPRMKTAKGAPTGYCQIFRYAPGLRFGSYPSAGAFDTEFTKRFPNKAMRADVFLLHLGGRDRRNWAGRTIPVWGAA